MKKLIFVILATTTIFSQAQADWNTILKCEGGSTWIDVNSNQRQQLQLVTRNSSAVNYITGRGNNELGAETDSESPGYEAVWQGTQPAGVFASADFQGATFVADLFNGAYAEQLHGEYVQGYKEYVSFFRVDARSHAASTTGTSVMVKVTRDMNKCVNNAYDGRFGRCSQGTYYVANEVIGNWVFNNCQ